mmetsp:Transcript_34593/g.72483  ORF Transcript_34593/g.72483 Transcript_34593/m.72483 type:complete len:85 (+) Transcript_34593:116-370(+)
MPNNFIPFDSLFLSNDGTATTSCLLRHLLLCVRSNGTIVESDPIKDPIEYMVHVWLPNHTTEEPIIVIVIVIVIAIAVMDSMNK